MAIEPPDPSDLPSGRSLSKTKSLLRFISKEVDVETDVIRTGNDLFVVLSKDGTFIAKRRLAKAKCCQSESPCIGTIPIGLQKQIEFGLPPFVHVSLCYDQIVQKLEGSPE